MELVGDNTVDGNIYFSTTNAISAAGTTQGTATLLTTDLNNVTTVAAGAGVILPALGAGGRIVVISSGANALLIYPPSGATIDGLAANTAISIPSGQSWEGIVVATNTWETLVSTIIGTANQLTSTYGSGAITLAIASNPVIPGTADITIPSGTTAQRPTSAVAMMRYNTTENIFEGCSSYPSGFIDQAGWQKTNIYRKRLDWEDDFLTVNTTSGTSVFAATGQLGWTYTASNTAALSQITSVADHPGIVQLNTGTTSGYNARIHMGSTATNTVIMANQVEYFSFIISIPSITNITAYWGLANTFAATGPTTGVYFQFASGTGAIQFFTGNGTLATAVNTVTAVANTWYFCEAIYNGTTWTPYVNGVAYTAQTTNIPTTSVNIGAFVQTSVGVAKALEVDYFGMITTEMGNRYP